jgi:anti-sigma-K factor RskA
LNIQDYISTGILESYVLGLASEEEKREVERLAHQYPEVSEEIRAIEMTFEDMAFQNTMAPPAHVKAALMEKIEGPASTSTSTLQAKRNTTPQGRVVQFSTRAAAAAVVLLVTSLAINAFLYYRLQDTREQYVVLLSEREVLAQRLEVNEARYDNLAEELGWLQQPGINVIALKPTGVDPQAQATIYWQPTTEEVYLAVHNLPRPPQGKQYQLWAIVDGKPVDAGMLALQRQDRQVLQPMKGIANAQAFAITLEQAGGSPSPTMDAMYVIGTV